MSDAAAPETIALANLTREQAIEQAAARVSVAHEGISVLLHQARLAVARSRGRGRRGEAEAATAAANDFAALHDVLLEALALLRHAVPVAPTADVAQSN